MITEDYVSFETAKLLKERGFDGGCRARYGTDGSFSYEKYEIESGGCEMYNAILAPTLQMAMKWLREVHNLFIDTYYDCDFGEGYRFSVHKLPKGTTLESHNENYSTYEECVEAGLKYSLENLI